MHWFLMSKLALVEDSVFFLSYGWLNLYIIKNVKHFFKLVGFCGMDCLNWLDFFLVLHKFSHVGHTWLDFSSKNNKYLNEILS